ncbi:MAG: hypothetical protein Q7S00_05250, partial [bacterium]|nr:hypothetical protein [bacterium]
MPALSLSLGQVPPPEDDLEDLALRPEEAVCEEPDSFPPGDARDFFAGFDPIPLWEMDDTRQRAAAMSYIGDALTVLTAIRDRLQMELDQTHGLRVSRTILADPAHGVVGQLLEATPAERVSNKPPVREALQLFLASVNDWIAEYEAIRNSWNTLSTEGREAASGRVAFFVDEGLIDSVFAPGSILELSTEGLMRLGVITHTCLSILRQTALEEGWQGSSQAMFQRLFQSFEARFLFIDLLLPKVVNDELVLTGMRVQPVPQNWPPLGRRIEIQQELL